MYKMQREKKKKKVVIFLKRNFCCKKVKENNLERLLVKWFWRAHGGASEEKQNGSDVLRVWRNGRFEK